MTDALYGGNGWPLSQDYPVLGDLLVFRLDLGGNEHRGAALDAPQSARVSEVSQRWGPPTLRWDGGELRGPVTGDGLYLRIGRLENDHWAVVRLNEQAWVVVGEWISEAEARIAGNEVLDNLDADTLRHPDASRLERRGAEAGIDGVYLQGPHGTVRSDRTRWLSRAESIRTTEDFAEAVRDLAASRGFVGNCSQAEQGGALLLWLRRRLAVEPQQDGDLVLLRRLHDADTEQEARAVLDDLRARLSR